MSLLLEALGNMPAHTHTHTHHPTCSALHSSIFICFNDGVLCLLDFGTAPICTPTSDPVEIDPRSGDLRVRGELDFEGPNKTIMFTAVAYNPGSPDLNDTAIVIVRILDENDEAPVFGSLNYNASINEGNYSTELQFGLQVGGALVGGMFSVHRREVFVEVTSSCGGEMHEVKFVRCVTMRCT